jgi:hypothetical protein
VVIVGEHSFRDDPRKDLLGFLIDVVCGLAGSIDKSLLMPSGLLNVEDLLDDKLLRKHVDAVMQAIDSVADPIERRDAFRGVLQITLASIQIGMGSAATVAKRRKANTLLAAVMAKRSTSEKIDCAIAELAGPLETKHPTWRPGRIADEIAVELNKQLAALGFQALGLDAIRKRVRRLRTNARPSGKKRTDGGRSS